MPTNDQPSPASVSTLGRGSLVLLVSALLVLALEITLGTKSLGPSTCTAIPAHRSRQDCVDDVKQKANFGLRKPGYGRTPVR